MYGSTFTVSDLNRSQNPSRTRSLHGSQSHHNLQMAPSNLNGFNESFNSSHNPPQQYIPGYLMNASQGMPPPSSPQQFNIQPLESKDGFKRGSLGYSSFGSESLLGVPRPSPKGRSPRVPATFDDENAPPTTSLNDSGLGAPEFNSNRLMHRHSVGGFHPHSSSHTAPSPITTSFGSQNNDNNINVSTSKSAYPVTVFGFFPEQRKIVASSFLSMSLSAQVDYPEGENANWITVTYPDETEAARALRRNGEVMHGSTMIGVKWAGTISSDSANGNDGPQLASTSPDYASVTSPVSPHPRSGSHSSFQASGRSLTLKPSSSAFRKDSRATVGVTGRTAGTPGGDGGDWGIIDYQKQAAKGQEQPSGVLGQVNKLLFGW